MPVVLTQCQKKETKLTMDYKRITLYVLWGFVALMLFNAWQKDYPPKPLPVTQTQNTTQSAASSQGQTTASTQTVTADTKTVAKDQQIFVHTDTLNVTIDEQTGRLLKASLPQYPKSLKDKNQEFVLLNQNPDSYYTAISGVTGLKDLQFKASKTNYTLAPGQNQLTVSLTANKNGLSIDKVFVFKRNSYAINTSYHIKNHSGKNWDGRYYMQIVRKAPADSSHLIGTKQFTGVATSSKSDPFDKFSWSDLDKDNGIQQNIQGGWLAFIQHYFLTAWIPNNQQNFYYQSQNLGNDTYAVTLMGPSVSASNGEAIDFTSHFYVGPEIKQQLDKLAPHLSLTIDYGWLWMISALLFTILKAIHTFVGNWGVAIILLTVLIKLLFYKLSEKSYKSMAHMRDIQPKINALKEQYKNDRQAMGKATMQLYREEKVNPMGGCLPMIVQIPVFIALYYVLSESVQLRMADFLWIHDLSIKDPYYILPILMGVSMFIQQRLSPPPADPTQAKVMMFLPVFFTIIFLNFPAGLTLYWLTNNTISVLQQWHVLRKHKMGHYKKKDKKRRKK